MKRKVFLVFISFILILTGCGKKVESKEKSEDSKSPVVNEPTPEPQLQIIDPDSNTRPIAVMINNHNEARPNHAGLQDAYIVYEMIVEGGITRLMAIFKDQDTERIGSVRSSRHYYLDYALENDAIYTHFGWSERARADITSLDIDNVNGLYDSGFWRDWDLGVAMEHTAFTSIENIEKVANKRGYRMTSDKDPLLNYSIEEISLKDMEGAQKANNVDIDYSYWFNTTYVYDPINKVYNRFANGAAHVDAVTEQQYTAKNIIVYKVDNYSFDNYGRQELERIGSGEGYYITDGYAIPITWSKENRSSQTVYKYKNGDEIIVNDGNTYIQIQPSSQQLLITE